MHCLAVGATGSAQLRTLCPYWLSLVRGFSGPFVRLRFWLSSESGGLCFGLGGSFWLFLGWVGTCARVVGCSLLLSWVLWTGLGVGYGFCHFSCGLYRVEAPFPMSLGEVLPVFPFSLWPFGLLYCSWVCWALPFLVCLLALYVGHG